MRRNRLRWFGHVERRDELCWKKRIETLQLDGDGVKGYATKLIHPEKSGPGRDGEKC